MIIDLRKNDDKHKQGEIPVDPSDVDLSERYARLVRPGKLVFELGNDGWVSTLSGTASAVYSRRCDRCYMLEELMFDASYVVHYVIVKDLNDDREIELESKGVEYSVLKDRFLNLNEVFADQFLIAIEAQFVCREDCKGVCSSCRKSKNDGDCSCDEKEIDPRWAALKELKES